MEIVHINPLVDFVGARFRLQASAVRMFGVIARGPRTVVEGVGNVRVVTGIHHRYPRPGKLHGHRAMYRKERADTLSDQLPIRGGGGQEMHFGKAPRQLLAHFGIDALDGAAPWQQRDRDEA